MAEQNESSEGLFSREYNLTATPNRADKRENVRSKLALYYVYGFFLVIAVSFLIGFIQNYKVDEFKEMLLAISGVLSGPLGFIIGFYFKDGEINSNINQ